jgi:hypothetical protein
MWRHFTVEIISWQSISGLSYGAAKDQFVESNCWCSRDVVQFASRKIADLRPAEAAR